MEKKLSTQNELAVDETMKSDILKNDSIRHLAESQLDIEDFIDPFTMKCHVCREEALKKQGKTEKKQN